MLILFDQGTPVPIRKFLEGHIVETVAQQGWDSLRNGELLKVAEDAGFNVLLTPDKNIRYQHNLAIRTIAMIVLGNSKWPVLQEHVDRVVATVNSAKPCSYFEVPIPDA
jgi:hypothetical protein